MAALTLVLLSLLHIATAKSIAGGKLLEFSCSQQQLYGKYASQDGVHGITFFSRADDYLLITSFSGENIVQTSQFTEVNGITLRSVYIMGHGYIQHNSSTHSDRLVGHNIPLSDALQKVLDLKEITLLEEAAEAVGQKGINGKNTPAAMPFFMFALRVTQLHHKGPSTGVTILNPLHKRQSCFNTCPPCPGDECYGQCGYGCTCWSWACGDCCFHIACYDHDSCCREEFFQTRCLFPFDFSCDQRYRC